ncbi:MAG: phosphoglucosamine mutase [Firmicutes bacterium]|nr:phosphoglucosamine mutase [Bacillota bacterium]
MGHYFGTDGIRGKAYDYLNFDLAFRVGRSLKLLSLETLVIGRDTRESGEMLVDAIKQGAKISGIDVLDIGIVSTPVLSYISQIQKSLGVMITASHNPYHDNGIKVFLQGKKLFEEEENVIELFLDGKKDLPLSTKVGHDLESIDVLNLYKELFNDVLVKTNFKIGLDLANGATIFSAPFIFQQMTDNLFLIGNHPDGRNINQSVGSTHIETILQFVQSNQLDFGISFDGDGDRLIVVDSHSNVYDGDYLLYVMALYLENQNLLKHHKVALTKMSNLGIIKALEKHGIEVIQTNIGDKYIFEALEKNNIILGGENSGHIINKILLNTGDGVLNAAFLIKILFETNQSLQEITSSIKMYPDKLVNLHHVNRDLVQHEEVLFKVNEIKEILGSDGKILVRASGTEPLIRISVSAKTEKEVDNYIQLIVSIIDRLNH